MVIFDIGQIVVVDREIVAQKGNLRIKQWTKSNSTKQETHINKKHMPHLY